MVLAGLSFYDHQRNRRGADDVNSFALPTVDVS
jgi:hypothetical protein